MSHPALELQSALIAHYRADAQLAALLAGGIEDAPRRGTELPYVAAEAWSSQPLGGDGWDASRHRLGFSAWSQSGGRKEALDILARLRSVPDALATPGLAAAGHRLVALDLDGEALRRSRDGRLWQATVTFRAVTEPL